MENFIFCAVRISTTEFSTDIIRYEATDKGGPAHILEKRSSYIDLIFANQPNIVLGSGAQSSLRPEYHHQIKYSNLNLKIEYPSPYTREIWDYNKAETDSVKCSIFSFDWSNLLLGKNVHERVELFN